VYDFKSIKFIDGLWCVVVGCHNIYETEIEKFIEDNSLQEWKII
jgi:hypothetical protein